MHSWVNVCNSFEVGKNLENLLLLSYQSIVTRDFSMSPKKFALEELIGPLREECKKDISEAVAPVEKITTQGRFELRGY